MPLIPVGTDGSTHPFDQFVSVRDPARQIIVAVVQEQRIVVFRMPDLSPWIRIGLHPMRTPTVVGEVFDAAMPDRRIRPSTSAGFIPPGSSSTASLIVTV